MPSRGKKAKTKPRNSRIARKQASRPMKSLNKKPSSKKRSTKARTVRKRKMPVRRAQRLESSSGRDGGVSSLHSGDLEGLCRDERADSESVGELVEEGNVFEAGAVAGVEEADDQDMQELHTHEVSEDDVPDEYVDKE